MSKLYIWDRSVRLSHWLLPLLFATSWITAELAENDFSYADWHYRSGYALIAVLIFRVCWGIWGPRYARFNSWTMNPIRAYRNRHSATLSSSSHGFWGSYMSIALLLVLVLQTISGLFSFDTGLYVGGPWSDTVSTTLVEQLTSLHHLNFELLQILIALHIIAIVIYRVVANKNYLGAMISGQKTRSLCANDQPTSETSLLLLGLSILIAIAGSLVASGYFLG